MEYFKAKITLFGAPGEQFAGISLNKDILSDYNYSESNMLEGASGES